MYILSFTECGLDNFSYTNKYFSFTFGIMNRLSINILLIDNVHFVLHINLHF